MEGAFVVRRCRPYPYFCISINLDNSIIMAIRRNSLDLNWCEKSFRSIPSGHWYLYHLSSCPINACSIILEPHLLPDNLCRCLYLLPMGCLLLIPLVHGSQMLHPPARLLATGLGSAVIYCLFSPSCSLPQPGGQLNTERMGRGQLFCCVRRGAGDKGKSKDSLWLGIKMNREK